jgi:hypothetical protein
MAETTNGGGSGGGLYFIVGILVAVVVVLGFVMFHGRIGGGQTKNVDINITSPTAPGK